MAHFPKIFGKVRWFILRILLTIVYVGIVIVRKLLFWRAVKVWVVIRWLNPKEYDPPWMLLGVYSTRKKAVGRCELPSDFIGPVPLDEDLLDEVQKWPGAEYPVKEEPAQGEEGAE